MTETFHEIEAPAGPPEVTPVDPTEVDAHRRLTYESYEAFLRKRLADLDGERSRAWRRDYTSVEGYLASVAPMRARLKQMLGFWVEPADRPPVVTGEEEVLLEEKDFMARRFRFEILPGIETYAVELIPTSPGPHPGLLAQHGYSGTPESVCGLVASANEPDYSYRSLGLRGVRRGFHVMAVAHPSGYGSHEDSHSGLPGFPDMPSQYGKNRLHRLAVMAGGTLFGLDMMGSSRGIDLLTRRDDVDGDRIVMYGLSQGGESALYLPALDERIKASVCSAYFNSRLPKLIGPTRATSYLDSPEEDKFFSEVVLLFSDPDIVSLIAPRAFAVEAGRLDRAIDFELAERAFPEAAAHCEKLGLADRIEFIAHAEGHVSATRRAFEFLLEQVGS